MNPRKLELSVGTFVVVGLMAVSFFAFKSGVGKLLPVQTYKVTARFANVGGLKPGSPVFIAGVSVGQVAKIDLNEQFTALVELRLPRDLKLPADSMAAIRTIFMGRHLPRLGAQTVPRGRSYGSTPALRGGAGAGGQQGGLLQDPGHYPRAVESHTRAVRRLYRQP